MAIGVPTEYRGLVVLGPCRIWRADGLWLCVRRVGATPSVPMLVCPSPIDVPRRDLPHGVGAPELAWSAPSPSSAADVATRRTKRTGEGDQWSGLRDYVPGDRLAAVHWPLSLRRGRLLVREMSSSCDDPLVAVVDLSRDAVPTDVDLAASWAAGIGVAALRRGRSVAVGMWRGGSTCRVVASETLTELLSVLALVETMEERCPAPCTLGAEEVDGGIVISAHNGEVCCRTSLVAVANGATEGAQ